MPQLRYPKRLIEVDLPIKRISAHSRREKSIRHGHISTLHIWWARRPLAACRAVLCASLWPDPADDLCPDLFRKKARELMQQWANKHLKLLSAESYTRFIAYQKDPDKLKNNEEQRKALLDFIADFANWDNSTVKEYLETSRQLTQVAHEALGGEPGTRPLVVDPFAGGGSIPLEALRVGADVFASDLNPVAVLLNKVVLEYIPKHGQKLADEVRKWGQWVKEQAGKELSQFYPKDEDGAIPIAYLWARTIQCEGPSCGATVPLIRSLWLAKKSNKSVAVQMVPNQKEKRVDFEIIKKRDNGRWYKQNTNTVVDKPKFDGTVARGSATCPCCGYTTPVKALRAQLRERNGGINDSCLTTVVTTHSNEQGRSYRLPTQHDYQLVQKAFDELNIREKKNTRDLSFIPNEPVNPLPHSVNRLPMYGMNDWGKIFMPRQALMIGVLLELVRLSEKNIERELGKDFGIAVQTCLALGVDKLADKSTSLCRWKSSAEYMAGNTFSRQALSMVFDYCEANVFGEVTGDISSEYLWIEKVLTHVSESTTNEGQAVRVSATDPVLPDDSADAFITDPPYYDMISYADLSDFFHVLLKRSIGSSGYSEYRELTSTPKSQEIIVEPTEVEGAGTKDKDFYLHGMTSSMRQGRRVLRSSGIGVIVFAHKSTSGWEALLQSLIDSGWIITGSWPIDTEMSSKVAGIGQARLSSSIHLVCRPRENPDGSLRTDDIGDWRDVLQELPMRIHEWMPRLAEEGVVGADAIFACLGPALEVFSRYSKVEKASGEEVTLREYLEHVWAAVAKEALNMIFEGADAAGFEEDSRLTAMWLWTLSTRANGNGQKETADEKTAKSPGYTLEFDAARKIAQGLGVHLEKLGRIVEIKGDKARLLSVTERTRYLFGKDESQAPVGKRKKKDSQMQLDFMAEVQKAEREEGGWGEKNAPRAGETILDQLHQAMILFAAGRGEAMKRFLVEEGIGRDGRFWRLAQALSALYPTGTDEKRWVDGVLARKKSLGF